MSKRMSETTCQGTGEAHRSGADVGADDSFGPVDMPRSPRAGKQKCFLAKDVIYHEGERADRVYMVRSGLVKLLDYRPNGRARIVRLHSMGHWTGLEGLLGHSYAHTAIAVDDVVVDHFSVPTLRSLYFEHPSAFGHLLRQWYGDLAQADRWISEFSTGGIKARVARLLEYLAELEYGHCADRVALLTVSDMAEILGVTPESVSRILAGFKRSDVLHRQAGTIYRLDTRMLQREAQE